MDFNSLLISKYFFFSLKVEFNASKSYLIAENAQNGGDFFGVGTKCADFDNMLAGGALA